MVSLFDKEALFSLIKDLYSVIGIRISIFDDELNLVTEYPVEPPAVCALIRTTEEGRAACRACDTAAFERARKMGVPHVYKCHAGMTEAITPIQLGGGILGYSIFAHMLPEEDYNKSIDEICSLCAQYGTNAQKISEAAKELKTHSSEKIMASMRMLDAIASYLQIKKIADWKNEDISAQLKVFIDGNIDKKLTSDILCAHFYISRTKLYQLSTKTFGMGVSEFILNRRIEKAKELLSSQELSVAEVAKSVSFDDYNYFYKLFKKQTGISPAKYHLKQL